MKFKNYNRDDVSCTLSVVRCSRLPLTTDNGRRTAFTLIELLLVLVILAVLAAVVVPKFTHRSEEAKVAAAKADIASFDVALDAYEIDNSRFPTTEEGLNALVQAPSS